jgi:hypothetical protein
MTSHSILNKLCHSFMAELDICFPMLYIPIYARWMYCWWHHLTYTWDYEVYGFYILKDMLFLIFGGPNFLGNASL